MTKKIGACLSLFYLMDKITLSDRAIWANKITLLSAVL